VAPAPARPARLASLDAALLAGGLSTRMGRDKARLDLGGTAAATRLARLLAGLFEDVLLVGGDPPPEAPGRRVPDPDAPVCALRGLVGALAAARAPRLLVVATDLVLLSPELVLALVAWPEAEAVVPETSDGIHPLCAVYARDAVLPRARDHLARGRLALRELLADLSVSRVPPEAIEKVDPGGRALTNVNTPAELGDVLELIASFPSG
jgi:molybdopterin-guanine dinucleotide biosynthesis protein A